jgi:hypothetical protein
MSEESNERKDGASQPLTTWGNVVHLWEFSVHSVRLGKPLLVGPTYLTFENVRSRERRWKEPRLGKFED